MEYSLVGMFDRRCGSVFEKSVCRSKHSGDVADADIHFSTQRKRGKKGKADKTLRDNGRCDKLSSSC